MRENDRDREREGWVRGGRREGGERKRKVDRNR
jgi:hypothetical protein